VLGKCECCCAFGCKAAVQALEHNHEIKFTATKLKRAVVAACRWVFQA